MRTLRLLTPCAQLNVILSSKARSFGTNAVGSARSPFLRSRLAMQRFDGDQIEAGLCGAHAGQRETLLQNVEREPSADPAFWIG
jgi:hypothetical protein